MRKVVAHWKRQAARAPVRRGRRRRGRPGGSGRGAADATTTTLLDEAMELVVRAGPRLDVDAPAQAPGRLRPRRPAHGPARAQGRRRPVEGSKARAVLMTVEEFEAIPRRRRGLSRAALKAPPRPCRHLSRVGTALPAGGRARVGRALGDEGCADMLARLPFRSKLMLVVSIPLLVLLVFAGFAHRRRASTRSRPPGQTAHAARPVRRARRRRAASAVERRRRR